MKNLFTNLMKNTAKRTQNTGGGTSQSNSQSEHACKKGYEHVNQSRLASDMPPTCLPLDSLSIVSRQSDLRTYRAKSSCETFSVGQCSPHTFPFEAKSQLASSHQSDFFARLWKYAAMITLLLTLACGNAWGDVSIPSTTLTLPTTGLAKFQCSNLTWTGTPPDTLFINTATSTRYVIFSPYAIRQSSQTWATKVSSNIGSSNDTWSSSGIFKGTDFWKVWSSSDDTSSKKQRFDTFKKSSSDAYEYFRVTNCTGVKIYFKSAAANNGNNSTMSLKVYEVTGEPGSLTATEVTAAAANGSYSTAAAQTLETATTLDEAKNYVIEVHATEAGKANIQFWEIAFYYPVPASCSDPTAPTAFANTSVTSTTATMSITDAADAASYDIYASTSSTTPDGETTPTTTGLTTKTPTVTGLTANTTYYAWVRAVCDESHKSSWVALTGSTFTTNPTYSVTYNDNGKTSGSVPTDATAYESGASVTVKDNTGSMAKTGYVFAGWNSKDDGTGTNYAPGTTFSISANTTLYAKWIEGTSATMTWTLTTVSGSEESNVDGGTTDIGTASTTPAENLTTLTDLTGVGVKRTTTGKGGNTGKIETPASYDADKYVSMTFDVASGYEFTPTVVSIKTVAVSTAKDLKFEFVDENGSYSVTKTGLSTNATAATNTLYFTGCTTSFTGTVTVKIYVYGATNAYRLSTPLTITGAVVETPACSAPTSPSVTSTNWIYVPGEEIELTASATGTDASTTYTWYKGATLETAKAAGAIQAAKTSAEGGTTYTIASCSASDAYRYWCVISNGTGCEASASYDIKIYKFYLYDNTGGDVSNTAFETIDRTNKKISVDVALANAAYTYKFKVTDGLGTWYGKDETTITSGTAYANGLTSSGANVGLTSTGGGCDYTIEYYYNSNNVVVTYPASTYDITHNDASNGSYTIQIGSGAAVSTDTKSCDGSTITLAATPSSGYSLSSWSVTETDGGASVDMATANTFVMPAKDVTVGASFTCVTPTFGTNLSTSQVDYDKNASASALTVAATAGGGTVTYQWYSNDENNTDSPTTLTNCTTATYNPSTAATGTTYYYCVATNSTAGCSTTATSNIAKIVVSETSYTVTYDANGGSSAPSDDTGTNITLDDGSDMTGPSGYTFAGWNTNAKGTGTGYAGGTTSINADLDLYAIWKPTTACADGYSHVYSYYDSRRLVNGKRYNAIETTTWGGISAGTSLPYTAISGLTSVVLTKGCQAEDKIEAGYPWINSYIKVDKKSNTAGAGITITVASGYVGKLKIRAGGYSGNASIWNNGTQVVAATSGNATSQNAFTEQTIDLATGANLIQFDGNNAYVSHIDVKLTQLYTLTLDKNNNDASGSTSGSASVAPNGTSFESGFTAPTRTGYDVEGYYGEEGCTTKIATAAGALQASKSVSEVEYTNSSSQWTKGSGATLYANWTPKVYSVTLDADGGTINSGNVTEYTFGVGATLPNDVTPPSGAVFLGWYDGSTKVTSIGTTATGNKSYKAKYGRTVYDSYFYQTYYNSSKTNDELTSDFPSYMGKLVSNNPNSSTPDKASSVTSPHNFSTNGTTACYNLKMANGDYFTISALADVKAVRFYGWATSNRTITTTATMVSGTGSDLSIATTNISGLSSPNRTVNEYVVNISGASGYSSSNYYDYKFTFSGETRIWGIYVEKYTNVPVTGVSLNKSSTTLTEGDTEQLTATIAPANATNKGMNWVSSNTSAATVSSSGLITAEAEGETTITVTTSDGSYTATCDVTVEAFSCAKFAGKIFDLTVTTSSTSYTIGGGTEQSLSSDATIMDDCSAYMGKLGSSTSTSCLSSTKLKLDVSSNADKYVKITPKCALRNGDVISCTGSSQEIAFSTTKEKVSAPKTSSYSYTVTPGDGLAGATTIYVWGATSNATVGTLTITRPTSYVITYNPNGGRDEVDAERFAAGANTLTTDVPTRAGYIFKEWNTSEGGDGTGYAPGAAYTMGTADAELYAKWATPTAGEMVYASVTMTGQNAATAVNGTALVSKVGQSDDDDESGYKLNNTSDCYFGITLANGNFKENDKIVVDIVAKGTTLDLCKASDGASFYQFTSLTNGTDYKGDNALQMTITSDMVNPSGSVKLTNTIAIKRTGTSPFNIAHFVRSIKVYREICPGCMALKSGVTTWSTTASDWIDSEGKAAAIPGVNDVVYVDKNITVTSNAAKAKDVILGDGKSLTIAATGGLVVAGMVTTSGGSATTPSDLAILSSSSGTGALITGEESTTTQAAVQFYSKARYESGYVNQFIGVPLSSMTAYNGFYGTSLRVYDDANDKWQVLGNNAAMYPFTAYNLMRKETSAGTLYMEGALNLPGTEGKKELTITRRTSEVESSRSDHLFANSWTAPIDIASMDEDDFDGADATIYIFNAGTTSDYATNGGNYTTKQTTNPGQWLYMPVEAVKETPSDFSLTVIPSMQAFMVHCAAENLFEAGGTTHTLTLDYKKHVYDPAKTSGAAIVPNRAPRREASEAKHEIVRVRVEGTSGYADDLLLFIGDDFSNGYDNGWEAYKVSGKAYTPQLYAVTEDGRKAISAQPDADNTVIGFKAGTEDDVYTFTLDYEGNDASLYLHDTYTDDYVRVEKDATYTFLTTDNTDHPRFVLTRFNAPQVTTGVDDVQWNGSKARKLMIDGILYIIRDGRIYNAEGAMVK